MMHTLIPFILINGVFATRILLVIPFPSKSHHIFTTAIVKALAERGHHIVEYSPYPPKIPIPNHTHVDIHTRFEERFRGRTYKDFILFPAKYEKYIFGFKQRRIWEATYQVCEDTFKHKHIKKLLNSNEYFDLVMTESTFGMESLLALAHRFSAPTITIEGFFPWSALNHDAGNALSISSVPDLSSAVFTNNPMTFKERFWNSVSVLLTLFFYQYRHLPKQEAILKNNYDWPNRPSVEEMVKNVSLYLTNSHPLAVNYIQPYSPNIIPIGGIQINSQQTQPSQEIKTFMDAAEEGVIYFSLGTLVPTHLMPREILQIFTNVFRALPQRVIWKIDVDSLPDLPENVMITKWVSQLAVLEHPNCVLFITHGGLFSHHESIYSGVPTVGIPFFSDQPYNVKFREHSGSGVGLDFHTLSEESFHSAITSVLTNPKYKESAARLSRVYQNRPMSASASAVYWVEYVIRHRGAAHLRPASAHMPFYQRALLDIAAAVIVTLLILLTSIHIVLKSLILLLCTTKGQRKIPKSKKS